jgi:Tfp pilus assembly protein PilO
MELKSRERILIIFVLIAIAIWSFDRFYYTSQSQKISKFKEEIKAADLKMEQFLLLTKGVETAEATVARLENELKGLSERTLRGEEFRAFLRHLAKESDSLQMKVISLTPQEEKLISEVGIDSKREGRKASTVSKYKKVNVQIVLQSTYAKLGIYLKEIEKLPFFVNVDSLEIERNEEIVPFVKATIGLSMYIIGD